MSDKKTPETEKEPKKVREAREELNRVIAAGENDNAAYQKYEDALDEYGLLPQWIKDSDDMFAYIDENIEERKREVAAYKPSEKELAYRNKHPDAVPVTREQIEEKIGSRYSFHEAAYHVLGESKRRKDAGEPSILSFDYRGVNTTITPDSDVEEAFQASMMDNAALQLKTEHDQMLKKRDQEAKKRAQEPNGARQQTKKDEPIPEKLKKTAAAAVTEVVAKSGNIDPEYLAERKKNQKNRLGTLKAKEVAIGGRLAREEAQKKTPESGKERAQEPNGARQQTKGNETIPEKLKNTAAAAAKNLVRDDIDDPLINAELNRREEVKKKNRLETLKAKEKVVAARLAREEARKKELGDVEITKVGSDLPSRTEMHREPSNAAENTGPAVKAAPGDSQSKFANVPKTEDKKQDGFANPDQKRLCDFLAGHSGAAQLSAGSVKEALGAEFMGKLAEDRGVVFKNDNLVELHYETGEKLYLIAQRNPETGANELVVSLPKGTPMTEEIAQDMIRIQKARGADVLEIGKKNASFEQRAMLLEAAKAEGVAIKEDSFSAREWKRLEGAGVNDKAPSARAFMKDLNKSLRTNEKTLNSAKATPEAKAEAQQNLARVHALHAMMVDKNTQSWAVEDKKVLETLKIVADGKKAEGRISPATFDRAMAHLGATPADIKKLDQEATAKTEAAAKAQQEAAKAKAEAKAPATKEKPKSGTIPGNVFSGEKAAETQATTEPTQTANGPAPAAPAAGGAKAPSR